MSASVPLPYFRKSPEDLVNERQQSSCKTCIFIRRFDTFTCALDDTKTGDRLTRCAEYDDLV